jgi:hypothetical protein
LTNTDDGTAADISGDRDRKSVMNPIEVQYRNHKIVIRNAIEYAANGATGKIEKQPFTRRIIEVDDVDVTNRCRVSDSDEQKTETAKRFIDRVYPKGKSES